MPGDPRREMRKGEGRQGKTTYRRTTGESSMGPLFLPPKPGVIAYAGKAVASMCVQITFKIHVLPEVGDMLFQEKTYRLRGGLSSGGLPVTWPHATMPFASG
jgi:hypothetical protein